MSAREHNPAYRAGSGKLSPLLAIALLAGHAQAQPPRHPLCRRLAR